MDLKEYLCRTKTPQLAFAMKLGVYPQTVGALVQKKITPRLGLAMKVVALTGGQVTYREMLSKKDLEDFEALEK